MEGVPFFTNLQCDSALPWKILIDELEVGLTQFSNGQIEQPVRAMLEVKKHSGFLGLMPCYSKTDNVVGCKLVSVYPQNSSKYGISSHIVYVLLFDATTGALLAFMEGDSITKRRTAATSALSARWLAPKSPKILAILGAGHQALAHMQVLLDQFQSIEEIHLWNHRKVKAIHLAEEVSGWITKDGQKIEVFEYVEDCVKNADLIVTATFASNPVLKSGLKKQNCHIMAVGAPRPEWSEIDPDIWNSSQVYVDSYSGAMAESGDLIESKASIKEELGTWIGKNKQPDHSSRTIFKSLGLAIEDLVAARMTFETTKKSSPWPIQYIGSDVVEKQMNQQKIRENETVKSPSSEEVICATNEVTNLKCKAVFVPSFDVMVCEMKTSGIHLALVYKARTGELKKVLNISTVSNLSVENRWMSYRNF